MRLWKKAAPESVGAGFLGGMEGSGSGGFQMGVVGALLTILTAFAPQPKPAPPAPKPPPPPPPDIVNVQYGMADGQPLFLDIYKPHSKAPGAVENRDDRTSPVPGIVFIHGGAWKGGDKKDYATECRFYADHGYVCFTINYRLLTKDGGNLWPVQLDDSQLAVRWVRKHAPEYGVDPDRIAGMGGSAGGHLVAMLAVRDTRATGSVRFPDISSKINCGIEMAGPADLSKDFRHTTTTVLGPLLQELVDNLVGAPAASVPDRVRDASPVCFVDSHAAPLLIFQGNSDPIVPWQQSEELYEKLKQAGADVRLIILKKEGHGLTPEHLKIFRRESLEFLDWHLRDRHQSPLPGKKSRVAL